MKNQDPFANPNIAKTIRDRYHDRNHNNDYAKNNLGFGLFHYAFIRNIRPANVLVVGSQRGYVPSICGVACRDEGAGTVDFVDAGYSIDETNAWGGVGIWKTANKDYWEPVGCQNIIRIHNMRLENFSSPAKYQYIYIDGDHSYEGVKHDFHFSEKLLAHDGYMALHDITVEKETKYGKCGVKRFWEEITADHEARKSFEFLSIPFAAGLGFARRTGQPTP